jgi:hypothetical protein
VVQLSYPTGSSRPTFNVLPALKDEGIDVPTGMCLDVPVALVLDEGVLKVEVMLLKGEQRAVKSRDEEENEA